MNTSGLGRQSFDRFVLQQNGKLFRSIRGQTSSVNCFEIGVWTSKSGPALSSQASSFALI